MRQTEFDELLALLDAGGYHLKETDLNPMAEPDAKATSTEDTRLHRGRLQSRP